MMDFSFLSAAALKAKKQAKASDHKQAKKPAKKRLQPAINKPPHFCQVGNYQLLVKPNKRRKTIALKLQNQQPLLAVPSRLSSSQLKQFIQQHHDWILNKLEQIMAEVPTRFQALPQQSFEFKGQKIVCQLFKEQSLQVDLLNNLANFSHVPESAISQQQHSFQQLQQWFIQQAELYLQPKLDYYAQQMALDYQSMQVKTYKSRWGSCYSDGRIQFNWRLMQAPQWVIDYVVVHELAHLQHPNHSKAFWQLVELHYPQTRLAKQQLKQHGARWIDFLQL